MKYIYRIVLVLCVLCSMICNAYSDNSSNRLISVDLDTVSDAELQEAINLLVAEQKARIAAKAILDQNESFVPFVYSGNSYAEVISGVRFDLDEENMPVIIVSSTTTNLGERSEYPSRQFHVTTDDYFMTGSFSELNSGSGHYRKAADDIYTDINGKKQKAINIWDIKPGESYSREMVFQVPNFTDTIYIMIGDFSRRLVIDPQNASDYRVEEKNK